MLLDTTFQKIFHLRRKFVICTLKWLQYAKFGRSVLPIFSHFFRNLEFTLGFWQKFWLAPPWKNFWRRPCLCVLLDRVVVHAKCEGRLRFRLVFRGTRPDKSALCLGWPVVGGCVTRVIVVGWWQDRHVIVRQNHALPAGKWVHAIIPNLIPISGVRSSGLKTVTTGTYHCLNRCVYLTHIVMTYLKNGLKLIYMLTLNFAAFKAKYGGKRQ